MNDPTYRVTEGADGAKYVHFFAPDRRVTLCLEPDGEACMLLAVKGERPDAVDLERNGGEVVRRLLSWLQPSEPNSETHEGGNG